MSVKINEIKKELLAQLILKTNISLRRIFMKYTIMILSFLIIIQLLGCDNVIESDEEIKGVNEEYNEYHGYFYKGPKYSSDTTLAYHFFNKTNFNVLFQPSPPPFEPDTIPSTEVPPKEVIAIVKYGKKYFDINITSVERLSQILLVKYTSELKADSMSWTAAIPMIITTKSGYSRIKFYENGELIKEIGLED